MPLLPTSTILGILLGFAFLIGLKAFLKRFGHIILIGGIIIVLLLSLIPVQVRENAINKADHALERGFTTVCTAIFGEP